MEHVLNKTRVNFLWINLPQQIYQRRSEYKREWKLRQQENELYTLDVVSKC